MRRRKLYEEILEYVRYNQELYEEYPHLKKDAKEIVQLQCYRALNKIKKTLEKEWLDDETCFMRVEEIICALEDIGSGGGLRHDG